MREDIAKTNGEQLRMKQLIFEKELMEEKRVERFTREKEELDQMKKDREEAKVKHVLDTRQAMIDVQIG